LALPGELASRGKKERANDKGASTMSELDGAIERILASYEQYGGINLTDSHNFPNRESVIGALTTSRT
jgi:hypothetical protein